MLALLAWTFPAVLSASLIIVREGGGEGSPQWWPSLIGQLPSWWVWALLTLPVLALATRFPIRSEGAWRALVLHALLGFGVVIVYMAAEAPFAILREGRTITPTSWVNATLGGLAFRFTTNYLIYFALVGLGHAIRSTRELRDREFQTSRLEAELADRRLASLRAQLQPHFLFNTLHAISSLVREGDRDRAVRMISGLSGLLRHTLDHVRTPEIPLHEELEALERYLEIEEVRFEDRLEIGRDIDPRALDINVPALLLQPLVENAIRHGIEERALARIVEIRARLDGDVLELRVTDDGKGLPADFDLAAKQGVGLSSTRKRLEQLYGGDAHLEVCSREPHGTQVTARVPARKREIA